MAKAIEEAAAAARGMRKRGQERREPSDWDRADWEEMEGREDWIMRGDERRRREREEVARREMIVEKKPIGEFCDERGEEEM